MKFLGKYLHAFLSTSKRIDSKSNAYFSIAYTPQSLCSFVFYSRLCYFVFRKNMAILTRVFFLFCWKNTSLAKHGDPGRRMVVMEVIASKYFKVHVDLLLPKLHRYLSTMKVLIKIHSIWNHSMLQKFKESSVFSAFIDVFQNSFGKKFFKGFL